MLVIATSEVVRIMGVWVRRADAGLARSAAANAAGSLRDRRQHEIDSARVLRDLNTAQPRTPWPRSGAVRVRPRSPEPHRTEHLVRAFPAHRRSGRRWRPSQRVARGRMDQPSAQHQHGAGDPVVQAPLVPVPDQRRDRQAEQDRADRCPQRTGETAGQSLDPHARDPLSERRSRGAHQHHLLDREHPQVVNGPPCSRPRAISRQDTQSMVTPRSRRPNPATDRGPRGGRPRRSPGYPPATGVPCPGP